MTTFSNYQAAVIEAVKAGRAHTVVNAKAGAGKSFTILSAAAALSASNALNGGTLMLAFNKDIAAELAKKAKDRGIPVGGYGGVTIKTFHALGFGAWRNYMGRTKVQIDDKKSWNILKYANEINEAWDDEFIREYGSVAVKLVAYAKNSGVGCIIDGVAIDNSPAVFEGIFHHHNMELSTVDSNLDDAIELAMWLLDESAQVTRFIDYNDMLWLPVYYRASFFKNQRVFVDELQDTNPLQLEIAVRSLKDSGQFIGVGDPNQAIYGFRGADSNAFNSVIDRFEAQVLPLSICYRCARSIISEAQRIVPSIEAAPNAIEGKVETIYEYKPEFFKADDIAILCRNNAPLISMAYALLKRGIPAQVLGRDIGTGLVALIDKMKATDFETLNDRLDTFFTREIRKANKKGLDNRVQQLEDQQACIEAFIDNLPETSRTIAGLKRAISRLFSDEVETGVVTLSSIHKSKGKEWANVCILERDLMPSPYARKDWMKEQEANLEYVAITRAMVNLYYIESNCWKVENKGK